MRLPGRVPSGAVLAALALAGITDALIEAPVHGLQLQVVSGYTPLQAGVSLLPLTLLMLVLSSRAGALAQRVGAPLEPGNQVEAPAQGH